MNLTLFEAARYMDDHGWCQKVLITSSGQVCLMGAINFAAGSDSKSFMEATIQLRNFIKNNSDISCDIGMIVPNYNDYILTSKEEAVKTLMEAAEWVEDD